MDQPWATKAFDPALPTWTLVLKFREPKPEPLVAKLRVRGWEPPRFVDHPVEGREDGRPVRRFCRFCRMVAFESGLTAVYYSRTALRQPKSLTP